MPFIFYCILIVLLSDSTTVYASQKNKLDSLKNAYSYHISNNDTSQIFKTMYRIANIYFNSGNYTKAKIYLQKAVAYANTKQRLRLMNKTGVIYWSEGNYVDAIKQYRKVVNSSKKAGDRKMQAMALNNIGFVYEGYNNLEKAREYYTKALEIRGELGNRKQMVMSYISIARLYYKNDSNHLAMQYYFKAFHEAQDIDYKAGESNALNSLGHIFRRKEDYQMALKYFQQAYQIRNLLKNRLLISESYKNLARAHIELGNYKRAGSFIDSGLHIATTEGYKKKMMQFYYLSYDLLRRTEKFKNALDSYIQYAGMRDSILSKKSEKEISELELKYETAKKEKKIELLDKENKIKQHQLDMRNYMLASAVLIIMLIVAVSLLFFRQNRLKTRFVVEQNKQKLLRSQMNPHFIYNALSAIQNFVLQNKPIDSVGYIAEFSSLMRLVLHGSRNEFVSLDEDIRLNTSYLKLQQLRFANAFQYEIIKQDINQPELMKIPPMLSQPFIENAVEHGVRKLPHGQGLIQIKYRQCNNHLLLTICDNGIGIDETHPVPDKSKHKSLAIKITNERIDNIKKTSKRNILMKISGEKNKGTQVEFEIPL